MSVDSMGRFEKRIFGWTSLIAYAVAACSFLLLAFACVNAISIKDGMLIIEERRFWKLKSSVRVPVSEIESVYLSDGDSKKHVVICRRDALESKYWFRMSWLSSFGNKADRIRDSIECSIREQKDLETITVYRASENFLVAGIWAVIGIVIFLTSLRKSREASPPLTKKALGLARGSVPADWDYRGELAAELAGKYGEA